jgi:hypothetical protein
MDFLKKHYEKLILTVVLAGLLGAAGWLLWQVNRVKAGTGPVEEVPDRQAVKLDGEHYQRIIAGVTNAGGLVLESPRHPVFNPWTWLLNTNDRTWTQQKEIGPSKLLVTNQTPLHLIIDPVASVSSDRTNLTLGLTREYLVGPTGKRLPRSVSLGTTNRLDGDAIRAVLKAVRNPGGEVEMDVDLLVANEPPVLNQTLTKANPFKRLIGYEVDIVYPPVPAAPIPKKLRVGGTFVIDGETYKIIAITETELRVESSSGKPTTVPIKPRTP